MKMLRKKLAVGIDWVKGRSTRVKGCCIFDDMQKSAVIRRTKDINYTGLKMSLIEYHYLDQLIQACLNDLALRVMKRTDKSRTPV